MVLKYLPVNGKRGSRFMYLFVGLCVHGVFVYAVCVYLQMCVCVSVGICKCASDLYVCVSSFAQLYSINISQI